MKFIDKFRTREEERAQKKVFHFFETVSNSVFVVIVGLFFTLFISVLGVSVLFFRAIYNQMAIFSLLGVVCFSVSYKCFLKTNGIYLRNTTYENFLISRRKLCFWVLHTFNFYFLFVWFILIILGSTNGFNITFSTDDSQLAFIVKDAYTTKITGFILLCVHLFLVVLLKVVVYYWSRMLAFAAKEFAKRKRVLDEVRSRVNKS